MIPKFTHIFSYMPDVLRWLPARHQIEYRMAALLYCCSLDRAPAYLVELCGSNLSTCSSHSLCSTEQGPLHVSFVRTSTRQKRAFPVVGPSIFNGHPLMLRSRP